MKKYLAVILCVFMLFCLVACGKADSSKTYDTLFDTWPSVFVTENITRITFYGYHGQGTGSDVPAEHMAEIVKWLDSFVIEKEVDSILDGTNTHQVEIEYSDGTVIKEGLDLIVVDGTSYYIKGDAQPDCFTEILSKTSLE